MRLTDVLSAWLLAAAGLVVPYFEVSLEFDNPGYDTRFTVTNTAAETRSVRLTIWTDRDYAVLWFNLRLDANASETISMRELLATRPLAKPCGKEADITIFTWAANCTLTTGCPYALGMSKNDCSKPAGRRHAHAIGYVTLEIIADCTDLHNPGAFESLGAGNLTGSYEQIVQGRVFASGPLIDRAATNWRFRRQRLPFDPLAKQPPKECQPILCILPPPVP